MNNISGPDPAVMEAIGRGNKVVFFDIAMGGDTNDNNDNSTATSTSTSGGGIALGRIKLELFVKDVSAWVIRLCM